MAEMTLSDIAKKMKDIDITMLMTHTDGGAIAGRPMSNNRDVDYDGDSHYFTWDESRMVSDIEKDPKVALSFQGAKSFQISVEGKAEIIRDKQTFEDHWNPDLDKWFEDGIDTDGLVMIKVKASRLHYWDGEEEGEVPLN